MKILQFLKKIQKLILFSLGGSGRGGPLFISVSDVLGPTFLKYSQSTTFSHFFPFSLKQGCQVDKRKKKLEIGKFPKKMSHQKNNNIRDDLVELKNFNAALYPRTSTIFSSTRQTIYNSKNCALHSNYISLELYLIATAHSKFHLFLMHFLQHLKLITRQITESEMKLHLESERSYDSMLSIKIKNLYDNRNTKFFHQ